MSMKKIQVIRQPYFGLILDGNSCNGDFHVASMPGNHYRSTSLRLNVVAQNLLLRR